MSIIAVHTAVKIDYTNWRGERAVRRVVPLRLEFTSNEWHKDEQWLMFAIDLLKMEERAFAISNVHSWGDREPAGYIYWNEPDTQRHFSFTLEAIGSHWKNIRAVY
jgi:predicted DNA-binding transcriptional regulator YafY